MGVIKRQGIKNTIITYVGILIGAVNIIFIQPKLLSEDELGLTRLLYDFSYIIGLAIPLGLPNIIIKYFPYLKDKEQRHHGFAGFVLLLFFAGFLLSAAILLWFKPLITGYYVEYSPLFVEYFMFVIPFTFIVSAITVTTAYCQSLFKSTIPSFLNDILLRVGTIVITVLYFNKIISFDAYIYFFIGTYGLELLLLIIYIMVIDRVSFKPSKKIFEQHSFKQMLRFGILLCLASFASIALRKIDGVLLGTASLKLVAVYTTAIFIASFIEVPLGALERISHTRIADNFAKNNLNEIEKIYKDSVKYLLLIGGLLFIGINACTRYVYELGQLPESYTRCVDVVYLVSIGALVNVSTGVNSAILFYSKHYFLGTVLLIITLAITVGLNLWLIPVYGIYGAALASLAGAIIFNLVKFVFIYVKFGFQPYSRNSFFILLLIAGITMLLHVVPDISSITLLNLVFKGLLGSACYLGLLHALKLAPDEIHLAMQQIRSRIKK